MPNIQAAESLLRRASEIEQRIEKVVRFAEKSGESEKPLVLALRASTRDASMIDTIDLDWSIAADAVQQLVGELREARAKVVAEARKHLED